MYMEFGYVLLCYIICNILPVLPSGEDRGEDGHDPGWSHAHWS